MRYSSESTICTHREARYVSGADIQIFFIKHNNLHTRVLGDAVKRLELISAWMRNASIVLILEDVERVNNGQLQGSSKDLPGE